MHPVWDQRGLGLKQFQPQRGGGMAAHIHHSSLFGDQCLKLGHFRRVQRQVPPARQAVFQVDQTLIQSSLRQRRRQMGDRHRVRPPLCQRCLGGVVGRVKIDIRHLADQPIRPIAPAKTCLLARHELQRAMHPEMQQDIGLPCIAQPVVELEKRMGRGKAALEQQAHRVALIAEGRLQAHEHIAKLAAQHKDAAAIRLHLAGGGAPDGFNLCQRFGGFHDGIGIDKGRDIRGLAIAGRIARQNGGAQVIHRGGRVHRVTFGSHAVQGVMQTFEHAEIGGRSSRSRIRRKAEQHDPDLLFGIARTAQLAQTQGLFGKNLDPFKAGRHRLAINRAFAGMGAAVAALQPMTPRKDRRIGRAINFRQSDQHGGFNRAKP